MDGVSSRSSSSGMCSIWKQSGGPPWSRASSAVAAARPPPALAPITATRAGSTPSALGLGVEVAQARRSSRARAAGYGCSGASRYSTDTTTAPRSAGRQGRADVLGLDAADDEAAAVDHAGRRAPAPPATASRAGRRAPARRGRPPSPAPCGPRCRASRASGMSRAMAASIASKPGPRRHGVRRGRTPASASTKAASSGSIMACSSPVPGPCVYLGCIRMPASMRIDSAFM